MICLPEQYKFFAVVKATEFADLFQSSEIMAFSILHSFVGQLLKPCEIFYPGDCHPLLKLQGNFESLKMSITIGHQITIKHNFIDVDTVGKVQSVVDVPLRPEACQSDNYATL